MTSLSARGLSRARNLLTMVEKNVHLLVYTTRQWHAPRYHPHHHHHHHHHTYTHTHPQTCFAPTTTTTHIACLFPHDRLLKVSGPGGPTNSSAYGPRT